MTLKECLKREEVERRARLCRGPDCCSQVKEAIDNKRVRVLEVTALFQMRGERPVVSK